MKRVEERQLAVAYRRLLFTMLPFGLAAWGLISYRWYTFFSMRDYSSVLGTIVAHLGHVSELVTFHYWFRAFRMIRESLPMVETTLFAVTLAMIGVVFWKFMRLPRPVSWQRSQLS